MKYVTMDKTQSLWAFEAFSLQYSFQGYCNNQKYDNKASIVVAGHIISDQ